MPVPVGTGSHRGWLGLGDGEAFEGLLLGDGLFPGLSFPLALLLPFPLLPRSLPEPLFDPEPLDPWPDPFEVPWLLEGLGDGVDVGRGPEETVIVTVEPWAMDVPPWADCRTTVPAG